MPRGGTTGRGDSHVDGDTEDRLRQTVSQLEQALECRVVIEQAKGYIACLRRIEVGEAFDRIRRYARSHNQTIQSVSRQVVDRHLVL